MSATWYKLKDGTWGVKIRHDGQPGEEVEVTSKKGETKTVILGSRAAKFDDAQLWTIGNAVTQPAPKRPATLDEEPF